MNKKITIYDKDGKTFQTEDEDKIFAKSQSIELNNSWTTDEFYVKKNTTGLNSSHLMNPNSMWFIEGSEGSFDKRAGRKVFQLSKVTKNCFDFYIKFLQTKNPAYLRNAEREIQ